MYSLIIKKLNVPGAMGAGYVVGRHNKLLCFTLRTTQDWVRTLYTDLL